MIQKLTNQRLTRSTRLPSQPSFNARMDIPKRQELLELDSVDAKMRMLIDTLAQEKEVLTIGQKITEETQEKLGKEQREFFLRRQLDAIRKELGEEDDEAAEIENY